MQAPRRIAIVGPSGAGKSTLARRLGAILGLPVYHLDALYWRPRWTPMPEDDWDTLLRGVIAEEEWIVDGNFSASLRDRIAAADTVIFLDVSRLVSAVSVVLRRVRLIRLPDPTTPQDSTPMFNLQLFRWIWSFPHDHRPDILALLRAQRGKRIVVLERRRDVRRFLRELEHELATAGRAAPETPVSLPPSAD